MVILQFNKLIRNKWIWGAFAVVVSLAFCADGCFRSGKGETDPRDYGKLGDDPVDAELFEICRSDISSWYSRGQRTVPASTELSKQAWKLYAALKVAEKNGIAISDESVARYAADFIRLHCSESNLDNTAYEQIVRDRLRMTVKQYEDFCRRALTAQAVGLEGYPPVGERKEKESDSDYFRYQVYRFGHPYMPSQPSVRGLDQFRGVADATVWVSPMEAEQAVYDDTDKFTVRVANFVQTKEEADAVKVDEDKLKAWYDENSETIKLPDLRQIKFVRFDVTNEEALVKAEVPEKDIQDYYDRNVTKYTTTGTNGTDKVVKPLEEVQDEIKLVLAQRKLVRDFKQTLSDQVFQPLAEGETVEARLETLAKPGDRKIVTSGWFSMGNEFVDKFMVNRSSLIPGATDLSAALAQLKMNSRDQLDRFAIATAEKAVYLVELAAEQKSHVPTFEESKGKIDGRVLEAERAKALKAKVEAVIAQGQEAVLATSDVTTNMTFTANDHEVASAAVRTAAQSLKKGEMSGFVSTGKDKGAVVVCIDRATGNAVDVLTGLDRQGLLKEFDLLSQRQNSAGGWGENFLERTGFTPSKQNLVIKSSTAKED